MVTENLPTLQSNKGFEKLRVQLEGAENRISVERKRYNEIVKEPVRSFVSSQQISLQALLGYS